MTSGGANDLLSSPTAHGAGGLPTSASAQTQRSCETIAWRPHTNQTHGANGKQHGGRVLGLSRPKEHNRAKVDSKESPASGMEASAKSECPSCLLHECPLCSFTRPLCSIQSIQSKSSMQSPNRSLSHEIPAFSERTTDIQQMKRTTLDIIRISELQLPPLDLRSIHSANPSHICFPRSNYLIRPLQISTVIASVSPHSLHAPSSLLLPPSFFLYFGTLELWPGHFNPKSASLSKLHLRCGS
jgi:hypothetical protein